MYIKRLIEEEIRESLFKGEVVIIYGSRQTGKTTLVKKIIEDTNVKSVYFNCDEDKIKNNFQKANNSWELKQILRENDLIVIDEAQRIQDIGIKLKLLVDMYPKMQIIATGSSSFDLSNKINEPLTGRNTKFFLHPFLTNEVKQNKNYFELNQILEEMVIFGSYPKVFNKNDYSDKKQVLTDLVSDYLFKDAFEFQNIKNSEKILVLLEALALQVGSEVSFRDLANTVGLNHETIENYIRILEQSFVIFRLRSYSKNMRQELNRSRKIYFYDNGVRNVLIHNLNPLSLRDDMGKIWENFVVSERVKKIQSLKLDVRTFFWRTYDGAEIDLVEEENGKLSAFEIKWQKPRRKAPKAWGVNYPQASWTPITKDNYFEFK